MVGIYVRALSEEQIEMQLKECLNKVNGEYILYKDLDNKIDAIKQLIEDVKASKINKVICKHSNKFSKDTEEVVRVLDVLKKHNVKLQALNINEGNIIENKLYLIFGDPKIKECLKEFKEYDEQCN
ncbi:recombinase family protein [Clostridium botulinum]|nr:recombinase family protein [Clostridium botulinum]NFD33755.1 recombinase family protein [Clostridium botulinum]NFD57854.1 recombinase family protein [Clostridium botulinum]NFE00127.1 recombinase family protein [Clostridium botulinum]